MENHRHVPGPPLDRFVDQMWLVAADRVPHGRQVLFPDGGITLHFSFGDAPGLVNSSTGEVRRFRTCFISGERTEPYTLDLPGRFHSVGIRLRPGRALPFLGLPARDLTGEVFELEDVWGPLAREAHERLGAARDASCVFGSVEAVLLAVLERMPVEAPPGPVVGTLEALRDAGPSLSIVRLASDLGVSHRTLLRLFDRWVGVTPKTAHRVLRFQKVIEWEDARPNLDWSEVAYACGYYDQAHLNRDFRAFTGTTPTRYRAARLEYPNYVPESA